MKKIILLTATLLATPADAFTVRGAGTFPCAQWNDGRDWNTKVQFALGWISGAESILLPQITDGTSAVANTTIIEAVTAWCRENPRKDIAEALMAAVAAMRGGR